MFANRTDKLSAQKVEVGVVFGLMLGTLAGAQYLAKQNIAIDVALRVLLEPGLRRKYQFEEHSSRRRRSAQNQKTLA